ncbi:MAG: hypothetical protein JWP80_1488 [Pseudomonas sp.]|nr:hypothetical protein [Pseudomonas sp.]
MIIHILTCVALTAFTIYAAVTLATERALMPDAAIAHIH